MKRLELKFQYRIPLIDLLANYRGPLGKINALGLVFDQVRFTDEERAQIKTVDIGGGQVSVRPPSPEFGSVQCELEDASASALLDELSSHQGFSIRDREWVAHVKRQLAAEPSSRRGRK